MPLNLLIDAYRFVSATLMNLSVNPSRLISIASIDLSMKLVIIAKTIRHDLNIISQ